MKLSVIIPVYNEEKTILSIVENVASVQLPSHITKEILIINDGSTDGTKEKLKELAPHPSIRILSHVKNSGKASAVKHGIEESTGDIIIIQDADMEYSPAYYPDLLEPILSNKASIVYGSRFKGNIKNMTLINRLANNISNITVNILYNSSVSDIHTCLKAFTKETIKDIKLTAKNFSFDTEITAKFLNKGHKIYEVPISYVARSQGKKINWITAIEAYYILIKCKFLPPDE